MKFRHYLLSRDARIIIIFPALISSLTFYFFGEGVSLLCTASYSLIPIFFYRRKGALSIIALICASGISHFLYLRGYNLFGIKQENIFVSVTGAVFIALVFSFYSIIGRPVIRNLAEQAAPTLKSLPDYGTPKYNRVWQEISIVWIVSHLLKAVFIYSISHSSKNLIGISILLCGWPLALIMIWFSFTWPKYRWTTNKLRTGNKLS